MGAYAKNTFIASSSQLASGLMAVEVLGKGSATAGMGAIQLYDIGNFLNTGALNDGDIIVFELEWYYNSGANACIWYLDNASGALSGNHLTLNTGANYGSATIKMMKGPKTATETGYQRICVRAGTVEGENNSIAAFDMTASEVFYIKADSVAATTVGYRWVAYKILGGA